MPAARRATKSTTVKKQEVFFDCDRETKGTWRFSEASEEGVRPVMGTIWVRKDVAEKLGIDSLEAGLKVTLEPDRP